MTPAKFDPRQAHKLIESWKNSKNEGERDNIEQSLRKLLTVEFSTRLEAHEEEVKQLEEKVRQLRARINLRREKQNEIVENRLQQLLRDAQGLGWGSEGIGGQSRPDPWSAAGLTGALAPASDIPGELNPLDAQESEDLFGPAAGEDKAPQTQDVSNPDLFN
jgi:hypothetical protein